MRSQAGAMLRDLLLATVSTLVLLSATEAKAVSSLQEGPLPRAPADGDPCSSALPSPNTVTWTRLGPDGNEPWPDPTPRPTMILDVRRHRLVMLFDTQGAAWICDLNSAPPRWAKLQAEGQAPPRRTWQAIVYDPSGDRMILIGGQVDNTPSDTTWVLSFGESPRWSILEAPGNRPPAGSNSAAVYDPVRNRILLFGGNLLTEMYSNGLWELRLTGTLTWRRLSPDAVTFPGLAGVTFVHDPLRDRFLLQGGTMARLRYSRSTLGYLPGADGEWVTLNPPDSLPHPFSASNSVAVYDPVWGRMILYGGIGVDYGAWLQLWALDLRGELRWVRLTPTGGSPDGRAFHCAVYDPVDGRMLVFGGVLGGTVLRDLWALSSPPKRYQVRIEVGPGPNPPKVQPNSGREIQTTIYGSDCIPATELDLSSLRLGNAAMSATHAPRFSDDDGDGFADLLTWFPVEGMSATPEGFVELSGRTLDGREVTGRDSVRVPTPRRAKPLAISEPAVSLALESVRSVGRDLEVRLSGNSGSPVHLEIFDVTGRRLWSGSVPAGPQATRIFRVEGVVRWSGICFARATQGEESVTRRFAILR